jgi:hypothetical protein
LAEKTLLELLTLLGVEGGLDVKDAADGGLSIAVALQGELPGLQAGRKTHVLDALQFLLNKLVNKPGTERRWISLGIGGHAEPRAPKQPRGVVAPRAEGGEAGVHAPGPSEPHAAPKPASAVEKNKPARPGGAAGHPKPHAETEERSLAFTEDPALKQAVLGLAEKSARLGRVYALVGQKPVDRAAALAALEGAPGLSVRVEGEGRSRRLVLLPDKPTPMPKRALPGHDDEDEMD